MLKKTIAIVLSLIITVLIPSGVYAADMNEIINSIGSAFSQATAQTPDDGAAINPSEVVDENTSNLAKAILQYFHLDSSNNGIVMLVCSGLILAVQTFNIVLQILRNVKTV